jgi:Na+-transporting NADH:ubiquinone oxidoreductase subunit D
MNNRLFRIFLSGIWHNNPLFVMVLGLCSSLAVTTHVKNALFMSGAVAFTMVFSSSAVSSLRTRIPAPYRITAYMLIISTFVILVDRFLALFFPLISRELGPYVGLIVTNCLVVGRIESFAVNNPPKLAALDAAGSATGFALVLLVTSAIREIFGAGTVLGYSVLPDGYPGCRLAISAPGAFLVMALVILAGNSLRARLKERA